MTDHRIYLLPSVYAKDFLFECCCIEHQLFSNHSINRTDTFFKVKKNDKRNMFSVAKSNDKYKYYDNHLSI